MLAHDRGAAQRPQWTWTSSITVVAGLSALIVYLQFRRKQLELTRENQRHLSGMLISAAETERSHIARELHDDFSQRLAVLTFGLENAAEAIAASPGDAERQIRLLLTTTSEIGADLHTLSHQLHSSTLERLGLVSGIRALCKEFTAQQGIEVDFHSGEMGREVAPDIALCLFRIVQEALRNSRKYSRTTRVRVSLIKTSNTIHVVVSDKGAGFDLRELSRTSGLGVRSMEERARLLGGRFEIRSEPGRGTDVEAWIPCWPAIMGEKASRAAKYQVGLGPELQVPRDGLRIMSRKYAAAGASR
jgi:signal transduction histidine kinase